MYIQDLREMVPPPSQNTAGICNQLKFLILYHISFRPLTLLKITDNPIQICDTLDLSSSSILAFRYSFFFPDLPISFTSNIVQIIYIALVWILQPLNFSQLPLIQNCEHSSSNHDLYCASSYTIRLSLLEILIFPLMFFQAPLLFLLSFKFSKAANLLEITIRCCFLTCSSLIFLRLNLSTSNFCAACQFFLNFAVNK